MNAGLCEIKTSFTFGMFYVQYGKIKGLSVLRVQLRLLSATPIIMVASYRARFADSVSVSTSYESSKPTGQRGRNGKVEKKKQLACVEQR